MSPLLVCIWIYIGVNVVTYALSVITKEHSWVDRIWSIVPVVYVWVFAIAAGLEDPRLTLMAVLVTLWGARLTFNFARKGGYAPGGEDYRWAVLRGRMKGWQFELFNLFFIVIYQNTLILLFTLPAWTAFENRSTPFGVWDVVVAVVFLAFLVGETVADQQQWTFHQRKAAQVAAGQRPSPRFLQSGLFRYSRHPNFFFEQAQWWAFFVFAALAAGTVLVWTVIGPLLLTLLFIGSTVFTESITLSRYPEYADYRKTTSPIIPWFPRRQPDARAAEAS
ncbi:DUF1295 domain-containing protein [Compostimonas suwonensis]|uniref:Steroid 5-alpha reductase family enzyme n=1 Tax=Compostimonas suwonensis TaxID=1048394 RepID=A0A2M9BAZ6_9MICO|nr:DUF1295 domain-containing protein [Compostimonas suwonensis]PJJ55120.1 steroid 5-alpha reductase family enzyme [Compostimonas suwonensis]